jgi:hypothetical protein
MSNRRNLLVAFLVGCLLAWLTTYAMGVLAAIPVSGSLLHLIKGYPRLAFLLHTTLLVHVPAISLVALVGWVLFRALSRASLALVIIGSVPWLAYTAALSLDYYLTADWRPLVKVGYFFSWYAWPGLLAVPLGLYVAYRGSAYRR